MGLGGRTFGRVVRSCFFSCIDMDIMGSEVFASCGFLLLPVCELLRFS